MKLSEQKKYGLLILSVGLILWIISLFGGESTNSGYTGALAGVMTMIGIFKVARISRIQKDPQKAEDYDAAMKDERVLYIANKARSMTFVIMVYAQLAAGLFCQFVLHNTMLNQVFCYLTCCQCILFTIIYRVYSRKY